MTEILRLNDVIKYYGTGSVVTKALDGVSFTVNEGEFTAIMGASGSGKSTLLNVISTIDRVSGGSIYLEERIYPISRKAGCHTSGATGWASFFRSTICWTR